MKKIHFPIVFAELMCNEILKIFLTLFLFFSVTQSYCQIWEHWYGEPGKSELLRSVDLAYDQGLYLLSEVDYDYSQIIKTDYNGEILWIKEFPDLNLYAITATNDGGVILTGRTFNYESGDPVVLKLDACFDVEWCHIFYSYNNSDYAVLNPIQTNDGNFVVHIRYYDQLTQVQNRVRLVKLDSGGEILWNHDYGLTFGLMNHDASELIATTDGGFILAGECYLPFPYNPQIFVLRPMIIKIGQDGEELWVASPGHGTYDPWYGRASDVFELEQKHYILSGSTFEWSNMATDYCLLCSYGQAGELEWAKTVLNDTTNCWIISACPSNNKFIISARIWQDSDDTHTVIYKIDTMDTEYNSFEFSYYLYGDIIKASENRFIINGNPYINGEMDMYATILDSNLVQVNYVNTNFSYDTLCPDTISSGIISTECLVILSEEELPQAENDVRVYPNPAKDWFRIVFPDKITHDFSFYLFDTNGQQKMALKNRIGAVEFYIFRDFLRDGMYFFRLIVDNKKEYSGKIVLQ